MHIKRVANVRIYEDATERDPLHAPRDDTFTQTVSGAARYTAGKFSVAASATEALSVGDIALPRGVRIQASAACSVLLNGTLTIPIAPESSSETSAVFIMTGAISSISIINSNTSAVTGTYTFWGDMA